MMDVVSRSHCLITDPTRTVHLLFQAVEVTFIRILIENNRVGSPDGFNRTMLIAQESYVKEWQQKA